MPPGIRTALVKNVNPLVLHLPCQTLQCHPAAQVMSVLEHFLWSLDGERGYLNSSTWTMNHASDVSRGLNIHFALEQLENGSDALIGRAMTDISVGDELRNNYCDFLMPTFYLEFCDEHGIKDVRSAVLKAVGEAP
jgi:hypothetical protein